ncbi:hypothetical protein [Rubidibacter lacunae]|uniref:hypothetical protein n=1 Tax=Rubidibacter lacunae TaxID=582514 RepID=UPI00058BA7EF|nr:hypothetical protein [Rubidibacter lacunae]
MTTKATVSGQWVWLAIDRQTQEIIGAQAAREVSSEVKRSDRDTPRLITEYRYLHRLLGDRLGRTNLETRSGRHQANWKKITSSGALTAPRVDGALMASVVEFSCSTRMLDRMGIFRIFIQNYKALLTF